MRVLAAMSGGVDSAVAAARLVAAGHQVTGVHLALSRNPQSYRSGARGCCSLEDSNDAFRAADLLGIPFYVWDLSERFHDEVVTDFVAEYAAGRTPNPCLRCNEKIKFSAVLERGLALGWDAVATGHYARLSVAGDQIQLRRAVDPAKDQSYVLGVLNAEQLRHAMFPLGDSLKSQVRLEAAELGLRVADKPDSHDICFIPDGDTGDWLAERIGARPGAVVTTEGQVIGNHDGTHRFTIGQRRGLNLTRPATDGQPRYVLSIEPVSATVTVGSAQELEVSQIVGERPTWAGSPRLGQWRGFAQVRAHADPVGAEISATGSTIRVRLDTPVRGVAPGQALVVYDDDLVIGSATITSDHLPDA